MSDSPQRIKIRPTKKELAEKLNYLCKNIDKKIISENKKITKKIKDFDRWFYDGSMLPINRQLFK